MKTETTINELDEQTENEAGGFHLVLLSADSLSTEPLPAGGAVHIGRSSNNDIRLDDRSVSRQHAILRMASGPGGPAFRLEDLRSANGTRIRGRLVPAGETASLGVGEAFSIGATVMMIMQGRPMGPPRRIWSHAFFEQRLEDACAQPPEGGTFALARLRFDARVLWTSVLPILAREVPPPHLFAAYGPRDYEVLFHGVTAQGAEIATQRLVAAFDEVGSRPRAGLACHPRDGRSGDALFARAHGMLRRGGSQAAGRATAEVAPMEGVRKMASRVACSSINVLVLGETGVGKEVLARLIHRLSGRADQPLVALNCAGLAESLIESELFGHERGAFTGATQAKMGLIESANGGTLFLDEIGEMPTAMQAKLLRVLETRQVMPVGSVRTRSVDIRLISATNRDLEEATLAGHFRRDLFYRLNGISLLIPPLRERTDEIPELMATFIGEVCAEMDRPDRPAVSAEAMDVLLAYKWPGNIRELRNVVERAVVLCDGPEIQPEHLPLERMRRPAKPAQSATTGEPAIGPDRLPTLVPRADGSAAADLSDPQKIDEKERIMRALVLCASNQTRAAKLLGISRRTLVSKLAYYGIPRPQKGPHPVDGARDGK
ncbi:MAG TPA: sigma 54-interacting transcriptional regulator [Polyangia bacterium]